MDSYRRYLSIDMVVDRFIFNDNQTTLSPCFFFVPKTSVGQPKTGVSFYYIKALLKISSFWVFQS